MATRTVTGTVYHPDGSAWASGVIKFILVEPFETSTEVYPHETYSETLDANGQFSITLGVPDTGTAHYIVKMPDNDEYTVYLASGAATTLVSLLTIASNPVDQDAVQTLLDANNVLVQAFPTTTYVWGAGVEVVYGNGTFPITLPLISTLTLGQPILIYNIGTGTLTVNRAGSDTIGINNATSFTLSTGTNIALIAAQAAHWVS